MDKENSPTPLDASTSVFILKFTVIFFSWKSKIKIFEKLNFAHALYNTI